MINTMTDDQILQTQIDLEGLLEVLSRNLYSTPIVVVRELIQNAHDACVRRRAESDWVGESRIQITSDPIKKTLTISDNGSGLTRDEVVQYLATIGSGYTRLLRQNKGNEQAIGYFGLGFLTAYVVSEKVEFLTTSYQDQELTHRFSSKGGQSYRLSSKSGSASIGSSVVVHLNEEHARLADGDFIGRIVRRYCCLLPIKVFVNDNTTAANDIPVPWRLDEDVSALRQLHLNLEFAGLFDPQFKPIATIPIAQGNEAGINGLLWIQDGAYYANTDNRSASVFIRSMHITDDAKELLPNWAGFVGCVIDGKTLTPTASRETVQQDEAFYAACVLVRDTLIDALVKITAEQGPVWRRLRSRHNQNLLGACLADAKLFNEMHQWLTLPTSAGEMTASEAARRTSDGKLTVALEHGGGFEQLVAKSSGTPLIHGYQYAVMAFCRELCKHHGFTLKTLGGSDDDGLFEPCAIDDALQAALENCFSSSNAKLVVSKYNPMSLPAVYVIDQDALLKKRIDSDELDRSIGTATMSLARRFTKNMDIEQGAFLYLNASNPIIERFLDFSTEKQKLLANAIISFTQLLANESVSGREQESTEALLTLLTDSLNNLAQEKN